MNNEEQKNQELKQELKNQITQRLKKIIITLAIKLAPIIIIPLLLLSMFAYVLKIDIGAYVEADTGNIGYVVRQVLESEVSTKNIVKNEDDEWKLNINFDDLITKIMTGLEENLEKKEFKKYFKKNNLEAMQYALELYIKAELITQFPDVRTAEEMEKDRESKDKKYDPDEEFRGCIQIERAKAEATDGTTGELLEYIDYDTFKAYKAANNLEIEKHFSLDEDDNLVVATANESNGVVESIEVNTVDYKSLLQSYTMPFDFLWVLTVMGDDEEFACQIAELALKSEILLTAQENVTTVRTTIYEQYEKTSESAAGGEETEEISTEDTIVESECFTNIDIAYVNTWVVEYINTYTNTPFWEGPIELEEEQLEERKIQTLKEVAPATISNYSITGTKNISYNTYVQGVPEIKEKTDKESDEANFVKLLIENESAYDNILSAPQWLFGMMESSPRTVDMVDLVKYLLYLASDEDYGVIEFDFGVFGLGSFNIIEGSINNLTAYLQQFSSAPKAVEAEDGNKYYTIYDTGDGVARIGIDDLQWENNKSQFDIAGKILHNGEVKDVENIAEYIDESGNSIGIGIEKSKVDDVINTMVQVIYNKVENETQGLDLSTQQIYALAAIVYDEKELPIVNEKTFSQVYNEGKNEIYENNSVEQIKYIWDNYWCKSWKTGNSKVVTNRDAAYETYVKGIFDFSKSDAGQVTNRKHYIYYTQEQLEDFAPNITVTRTTENEKDIFAIEETGGTYRNEWSSDCKVRGYYTSSTGREFTVVYQGHIEGWDAKCNRAAATIIVSGYTDASVNTLINNINSNKDEYGWSDVPGDEYFNQFGLEKTADVFQKTSASDIAQILRKQLQAGGHAMIWLNCDTLKVTGPYIGKSGNIYCGRTSPIHWVAVTDYIVEDGHEYMAILDGEGLRKVPIDEFRHGVAWYVLINEK